MSSKIEQLIDEIEEYIDGCKPQFMSSTNIIVNKEEIEELLRELRMKTPEEIKRYQKIISNKEAILNDARTKAENMISEATGAAPAAMNSPPCSRHMNRPMLWSVTQLRRLRLSWTMLPWRPMP